MVGAIGALILVFGLFLIVNNKARLVTEIPVINDTLFVIIIVLGIVLIGFGFLMSKSPKNPK